jgi:tetrahydromethanopterin S-methyltransferase subunit E
MLKAGASYISSKLHGVTFQKTVSTVEGRNMMITMAVMMMIIIIINNNKLPVPALENVGPDCDPCGGPPKVNVQSNKRTNVLVY